MEKSHIWICIFKSEQSLHTYFDEQYLDDEKPLNQFISDQNKSYYDHDFCERIFHGDIQPIKAILNHGYFNDEQKALESALKNTSLISINSSIILDEKQIESPLSITTEDYTICYVGAFNTRY